MPAPSGGLFTKDAFATGGLERRYLGGGFLIVSRDAGVADEHCTKVSPLLYIKQYLFATRKTSKCAVQRFIAKTLVCATTLGYQDFSRAADNPEVDDTHLISRKESIHGRL